MAQKVFGSPRGTPHGCRRPRLLPCIVLVLMSQINCMNFQNLVCGRSKSSWYVRPLFPTPPGAHCHANAASPCWMRMNLCGHLACKLRRYSTICRLMIQSAMRCASATVAESYVPVGGDLSSISREMRSLGEIWSSWSFSYTEKIYSHVTTSNSNYSVKEEITLCTLVGILLHPLLSNLTVCEG